MSQQQTHERLTRNQVIGYGLAGAACVAYGASLVLAKQVVEDTPALVGSTLGMLLGMLVLTMISAGDMRKERGIPARGYLWTGLGGLGAAGGITFMFLGMANAPVVVVAPIVAMNPLTAIFFGQIFIRGLERLTPRVIAGALLVVAGVIVIGLGQNV